MKKEKWHVLAAVMMLAAASSGFAWVIDTYEGYSDTTALTAVWTGTENVVLSLDTTTFYEGQKALKMVYNNGASPNYSMAERLLPGVVYGTTYKNFSAYSTMTVRFKVTDASGYLQVVLINTWGNIKGTFYYDGTNSTPAGDWVQWDINLNSVPPADLKHIAKVRFLMREGDYGSGEVYFDDVILSTPLAKVVEWKLDGNITDTSGYKNHAKATGTLNFVDGVYGQCLEFSGAGNATVKVEDANGLPLGTGQAFSLNVWVKPAVDISSGTAYHGLGLAGIGKHGWSYTGMARCIGNWGWGKGVSFISTGVLAGSSGVAYVPNQWQMITMTFDPDLWVSSPSKDITGDSLKVYRNGELIQTCHPQGQYYGGNFYSFEAFPIVELLPIIADHNTNYSGKLDDFGVWRGVLSPEEILELMPYQGDFDEDHDVDLTDLNAFAGDWLEDNRTSPYAELLIDDFERYTATGTAGQDGTLLGTWIEWPGGEWGGVTVLTLLTNPAQAHDGSKAMRWNYDNSDPNPTYSSLVMELDTAINVSQYDQFRVWMNRDENNFDEDLFYMKFILGEDVAAEAWITHAAGSVYAPVGWSEWVVDLHNQLIYSGGDLGYDDLSDITAVDAIMFGCGNHSGVPQGTTGQIDFDTIKLVDVPDCSSIPAGDFNGDCLTDLSDYAVLAGNWMKGVE